jgi:hypothetical protein
MCFLDTSQDRPLYKSLLDSMVVRWEQEPVQELVQEPVLVLGLGPVQVLGPELGPELAQVWEDLDQVDR